MTTVRPTAHGKCLAEVAAAARFAPFFMSKNRGKGAAVATGIAQATGDIVVIQDADFEYDPRDLPSLVTPIIEDRADVVFGTRFAGGKARYVAYQAQPLGQLVAHGTLEFFVGPRSDGHGMRIQGISPVAAPRH